jgi:hypothetical protein
MEKVGFFHEDVSEAAAAYEEQALPKKMVGGAEGLEISPAGPNAGLGEGLRRMKALNRIDIASLWRAMLRRPDGKNDGPRISLLAPRGQACDPAGPKLAAAGIAVEGTAGAESYDFTLPPGTSSTELVQVALRSLVAIGGLGLTGEWQWTVRPKGVYPR